MVSYYLSYLIYAKYWDTLSTYNSCLTIFEIVHSSTPLDVSKILLYGMANSVDPDQMLHSAASDLGLHCLQRPICPNT